MELIKDKEFGGERPLFATHDLRLENIIITDGTYIIRQEYFKKANQTGLTIA